MPAEDLFHPGLAAEGEEALDLARIFEPGLIPRLAQFNPNVDVMKIAKQVAARYHAGKVQNPSALLTSWVRREFAPANTAPEVPTPGGLREDGSWNRRADGNDYRTRYIRELCDMRRNDPSLGPDHFAWLIDKAHEWQKMLFTPEVLEQWSTCTSWPLAMTRRTSEEMVKRANAVHWRDVA